MMVLAVLKELTEDTVEGGAALLESYDGTISITLLTALGQGVGDERLWLRRRCSA